MVETGDIVLSKRGRDKGLAMVVVKVENNLAYLADGRNRKVTALKKKKSLIDYPSYSSSRATLDELRSQNSYFIRDLDNVYDIKDD